MSDTEEVEKSWVLSVILGLIIAAILYFSWQLVRAGDFWNNQLPACQEDEVLYPNDYKGPGQNKPSDYECIHIDDIVNGKRWAHVVNSQPPVSWPGTPPQ